MGQVLNPRHEVINLVRLKQQVNNDQVPSRSTKCTVMYSEDENVLPRLRGRRADMNEERC